MRTLLIRNADAIVTVDAQDRVLRHASLLIEGPAIRAIGPGPFEADEVIDAEGCFVYPGLINTHHHLYQTLTRNLPAVQRMELFAWLRSLYQIWRGLDGDCVYYGALAGLGELLKYGCTTCMDHHYVFPRTGGEDLVGREFEAAEALGVRLFATRGSMSRGESEGGLPPDDLVQDVDVILRDSQRLVETYHDPARYSMRNVGLAPCSPFSVTTDLLKQSAALARSLGVRLHTHLAETADETQYCLQTLGMRPLEYMQTCGWLGPDVWFAHGIHFTDAELRLLAQTHTGVAHCPVSNMKLASGVCRVPDLLALGVPVGLAVDGSASNDGSNLMAELRTAYLLHRLTASANAPTGYGMLQIATRGGAALLGRDDIGSLEPGKAADLFLLDTRLLELAGAKLDPANLLGTVGYARPARDVIVNGKPVVREGRLIAVDETVLAEKADAQAARLLARAGLKA